ncbi:unnamed protein product [Effrenium voratum]|uniref:PX domain-containing protein n=1 Tax=Effrenium voratum TaxID=2562239 RepID=A0AA36HWT0_9DINO|nr:unnamed protein product [Effrenium voratum]
MHGGYGAGFAVQISGIRRESSHVKYCIEIRRDGEHWKVNRRFRDLFQLHNLLRSKFGAELPALPTRRAYGLGKLFFGDQEEQFIAERQKELQKYLEAVLRLDPSLSHGALRLFLGLTALPAELSLEVPGAPETSWKTPKVDLRLLRTLLDQTLPAEKAHLVDAPLSVIELQEVAVPLLLAAGCTCCLALSAGSRQLRTAARQAMPQLRATAKVYVLSAWNSRPPSLSVFCPRSCSFEPVPLCPLGSYYAVASRRSDLYILTAGQDAASAGTAWRSSFHCWRALQQQWWQLPRRPGDDCTRFALATAGSAIYALGGSGRRGCVASCARFDSSWETLPPMPRPRCDAAAAARQGHVFLIGGTDKTGEASSAVDFFDIRGGQWRQGPPLLAARHSGAAVSFSEGLLLFGGSAVARGHLLADAVSPPDPEIRRHRWELLPAPARLRRHGCGAAQVAGKVYVFGGYEADMADVDVWDGETWETLRMPPALYGQCQATVAVS